MRLIPDSLSSKLFWSLLIIIAALAYQVASVSARPDGTRRELNELTPDYRESVLRGWRHFHVSYAKDKVACVHCHRDHEDMIPWAGAYPKVHAFDGTPHGVKTLSMTVIEALGKHSDLKRSERISIADDLAAYISWWGDGQPVLPGISESVPPPGEDLEELKRAAENGRILFQREDPASCTACHSIESVNNVDAPRPHLIPLSRSFRTFPRYDESTGRVVSLHTFLANHTGETGMYMETNDISNLAAFLADLSRGQALRPGH